MRVHVLAALLPLSAFAARIVQTNDDGWAEINIRTLFNSLTTAGHNVVLSAPAENQSGTGSSDADPTTVGSDGCEFSSCPAGSPATGHNASNTRLNYVNSYPVTSVKYGINTFAPQFFGSSKPDIVVSGPNVGSNLDVTVYASGTVGAATYAAHTAGIPAIAFSGATGSATAWNQSTPAYSKIYADLALNLTSKILASGAPYLPSDVYLNVNFPKTDSCSNVSQYKFVLSRIFYVTSATYVKTCNQDKLPWEVTVTGTSGCYVSVSVGDASDKTDANADAQAVVLQKLSGLLSCLP